MSPMPRPEYPRPQFVRDRWLCLNGVWEFEVDKSDTGRERGLLTRPYSHRITVPFCPESTASGLGGDEFQDYMRAVWYRRRFVIPAEWSGQRVIAWIQACDQDATVWVNGVEAGRHHGGFTPFGIDITRWGARPGGEVTLVVRARDDPTASAARGKQVREFAPRGCYYPRTTGIWQSVWIEPVPACALDRPRLTPDLANGTVRLEQRLSGDRSGLRVRATLLDREGTTVARDQSRADCDMTVHLDLPIPRRERHLWSPSDPYLYSVVIELIDSRGRVIDRCRSATGLRGITIEGPAILINGRPFYQRLILDQGYFPGGLLTAPTARDLERDIDLAQQAGFVGARLHQRVPEEITLDFADRKGYLVWLEFPDWGTEGTGTPAEPHRPDISFVTQWLEAVTVAYSHPAVVGLCGLNEFSGPARLDRHDIVDATTHAMVAAARALDRTRPVIDASGWAHRVEDIDVWDSHDYEQDAERFARHHADVGGGSPFVNGPRDGSWSVPYSGQPYLVSEWGGIGLGPASTEPGAPGQVWAYGRSATSLDEWHRRYEMLSDALKANAAITGDCYCQLTSLFDEDNGIYTFERLPRVDIERLRAANQRPAAIERSALVGRRHFSMAPRRTAPDI